jgi:hypothetical protein
VRRMAGSEDTDPQVRDYLQAALRESDDPSAARGV